MKDIKGAFMQKIAEFIRLRNEADNVLLISEYTMCLNVTYDTVQLYYDCSIEFSSIGEQFDKKFGAEKFAEKKRMDRINAQIDYLNASDPRGMTDFEQTIWTAKLASLKADLLIEDTIMLGTK